MYLDPWMIIMLILSFGICAFVSRRGGFTAGAVTTLQILEEQKMIKIEEDGSVKRWTPYAELPAKKKRKKG